ncbi:MAG: hypothetical protein KJO82_11100, partial [Gammaproteobacteria bacterium]|nr:hypothetical protein [Gammaproteobacteria bacterium]
MAGWRAFYITQESLSVFADPATAPADATVFADTDEGLQSFDDYLSGAPAQTSVVVVDVIEEEFAIDQIPKLGWRDRRSLMARRMQRKFSRTPYRLTTYQGASATSREDATIVHSAISNHELLDHWLQVMLKHEVPLIGVFSVPLMASALLQRFYKTTAPALFVTQHQGQRLRQVFLRGGHVQSARLSQSPAVTAADYAEFVVTEVQRSRRYLERTRALSSIEQLDVYIVADASLAESVHAQARSHSPMQLHFIDPQKAANKIGMTQELQADRMEALYLCAALKRRPAKSYAVSGECRFWHMRRLRHGIIGTAIATAAACSVVAALFLSETWSLHRQSARIENQMALLTETFRRENERFD